MFLGEKLLTFGKNLSQYIFTTTPRMILTSNLAFPIFYKVIVDVREVGGEVVSLKLRLTA